ncbi:hypothetical protein [Sediminibacterium sp.]|uniref:hypothetical protein n=1 Tax=Sediminibacterium sp. TaxID=1917865 RepID=UPI003F6A1818
MEKKQNKSMNLLERAKAPTPKFFRKLRNIGLVMAALSAAIVTAPMSLPAAVITAAGYVGVVGSVISAVSQVTTKDVNDETD